MAHAAICIWRGLAPSRSLGQIVASASRRAHQTADIPRPRRASRAERSRSLSFLLPDEFNDAVGAAAKTGRNVPAILPSDCALRVDLGLDPDEFWIAAPRRLAGRRFLPAREPRGSRQRR